MATKDEKNKFSITILELAAKEKMNHIEAITVYCEENSFEIELAAQLINDHLKQLIQSEAQDLRILPRSGRLSI